MCWAVRQASLCPVPQRAALPLRCLWRSLTVLPGCSLDPPRATWTLGQRPFTTASDGEGDSEPEEGQKKQTQKQDPRARPTVGSVGRKIPHRLLAVLDEQGEDLGTMHRADVVRLMEQRGLKLVPVRESAQPPLYRLMTGKQIHEEQIKLREKQKAKPGLTQVKEVTLSSDIAQHDLDTKVKQVHSWVEKKHHVRVTVRQRSGAAQPEKLEAVLELMVQKLPGVATFASKPKPIRDGRAAVCVLRALSNKELREHTQTETPPSPDRSPHNTQDGTLQQ
ncbi:IF3M factor, partial [Amia calva]|nr:IF3M factor [Amia calva]